MNTPRELGVRMLTAADLSDIARIHCSAFAGRGIALLGLSMTERYYAWQLQQCRRLTILGADGPAGLTGFLVVAETYGSMLSFFRSSALPVLAAVLARRQAVWQVRQQIGRLAAAQFRAPKRRTTVPTVTPKRRRRTTWFHSLGVVGDQQRRGIGLLLVQAGEAWARDRGYEEIFLAVRTDNHRAIRLYEGLGWIRVQDGQEWSGRMRKSLTVEEPTGAQVPPISTPHMAAAVFH